MKKYLLLLVVLMFAFVSCGTKDEIPEWDTSGIAYKNNSDYVPPVEEHETWIRTGFQRKEGTTGIIGYFVSTYIDSSKLNSSYSNTERYTFNSDGTYEWTHVIISGGSITKNFKTNGTYKLYIYSDKYYLFELVNRNKFMFYRVSDAGADITDRITTEEGDVLYADIYAMSLK